MNTRSQTRDLFGKVKKRRRSRLEAGLARYDQSSFEGRLERLRWVEQIMPKDYIISLPPETFYVFQEAKDSFISGQYTATLMLAAAFIEHVLAISLEEKGFRKEASGGMRNILKCLKKNGSMLTPIVSKIDHLQEIRNPFVHIKPFTHPSRLSQRAMQLRKSDLLVLEGDARESLSLMYTVGFTRVW
jgi:hypothetical protein